ncbi:hypothetical protein OE766_27040 [Pararhizobium sp. YC-54]|nr:hypothetical protein [Pararhizobium sp. YC-54]MCW0001873.1 hypothetical protein [Pararhizobium sp. YC-54]
MFGYPAFLTQLHGKGRLPIGSTIKKAKALPDDFSMGVSSVAKIGSFD